jgi:hypothetical protein
VVLGKDPVRAALFPSPVLDYSEEENDISMEAIYTAAAYIRRAFPERLVIIDGRTYLRSRPVNDLIQRFRSLGEPPRIIECVCSDQIAQQRLEDDLASGVHPAKNRTYALYLAVKARAEPIPLPHLVLDTGQLTVEECIQRCLLYLRSR